MKGLASVLLATGAAAALVGIANAQPVAGAPQAILFDQPNFQGHSITIVDGAPDLARWGFAGRAMSARLEGEWTLCEEPDLDGRCATVRGDVADLTQTGLQRVFSLGEGDPDNGQAAQDETATGADQSVSGDRAGGWSQSPDDRAPAPAPAPTDPVQPTVTKATSTSAAPAVEGDVGREAVFFAKPARGGDDVAVDLQGPANQFCRDQGLGPAVYFDTDGHVLRDVLCRRS